LGRYTRPREGGGGEGGAAPTPDAPCDPHPAAGGDVKQVVFEPWLAFSVLAA